MVGLLVLICITPMFLLGGLVPVESGTLSEDKQPGCRNLFGALCVAASPVLALLGLELMSRKLDVMPDGLALRSLLLDRRIPFDRVESVSINIVDAQEKCTERATVRSDAGEFIRLESSMPGYRAALDLLRCRAGAKWRGAVGADGEFA
jgi:hypothetical protein